jgi:hypothetical protein
VTKIKFPDNIQPGISTSVVMTVRLSNALALNWNITPIQWVPGGPFSGVRRGQGLTLTTNPLLVLSSRMSRSYTFLTLSAYMTYSGTPLLKYVQVKQGCELKFLSTCGAIIVTKPKYPAAYLQRICFTKRFALVPYVIIPPYRALYIQSNWNLFRACIPV